MTIAISAIKDVFTAAKNIYPSKPEYKESRELLSSFFAEIMMEVGAKHSLSPKELQRLSKNALENV